VPEEKMQTGLEAINRNARAQARLMGITTGKLGLQKSETDIRQLVKVSMDSIRPAANRKNIALTMNEVHIFFAECRSGRRPFDLLIKEDKE
jgi:hypothetical protein